MKVFDNINNLSDKALQEALTRVIKEIIPLRKNEDATKKYCEDFLFADSRKREYCDCSSEAEWRRLLENPFKLNDGEIPVNLAAHIRYQLLQVIENDKYSFGYLYFVLGSNENRERLNSGIKSFIQCVFEESDIKYTIDFDIDDLNKSITELDSIQRIKFLQSRLHDSEACGYESQFKDAFEEHCKTLIDEAKEMLTFERSLNTPVRKLPEFELTKEQKRGLQIAVDNGYIEKTETGYSKLCTKAKLAYILEKIFAPTVNDSIPYMFLEKLFNESRLDSAVRGNFISKSKWKKQIDDILD